MLNIGTILIAADFSACSEDAFQVARSLARDYGARIVVLHVATPPSAVRPDELQQERALAAVYRTELERRLRLIYAAESLIEVDYRVQDGDPAVEILDVARKALCDLIVIGTHGRTGLGRLLMGSVAEHVLREAPCPVMTIKTPIAFVQPLPDRNQP
jgi:nucleotide-binding universal stress UspA family protein